VVASDRQLSLLRDDTSWTEVLAAAIRKQSDRLFSRSLEDNDGDGWKI